jgi:hypothetical protein
MSDLGNALFVKVRVVVEGDAGDVPSSMSAVMSRLGGVKVVHAGADGETLAFYALISSTDHAAIASLGDLLADANHIRMVGRGIREIVVEVGRVVDLPDDVSVDFKNGATQPPNGGTSGGSRSAPRRPGCAPALALY